MANVAIWFSLFIQAIKTINKVDVLPKRFHHFLNLVLDRNSNPSPIYFFYYEYLDSFKIFPMTEGTLTPAHCGK